MCRTGCCGILQSRSRRANTCWAQQPINNRNYGPNSSRLKCADSKMVTRGQDGGRGSVRVLMYVCVYEKLKDKDRDNAFNYMR